MSKKYTYKNVNKAVKNVMGYMSSISHVWGEDRTLKLYDAFFKCDELLEKYPRVKESYNENDIYYDFCDMEYTCFTEWMKEDNIEDPRVYVGRTSTFYLTNIHDNKPVNILYNLLSEIYPSIDLEFNDDLTVKPLTWSDYYSENELIEDSQWQFEYIVKDFIYDVKKYMNDAVQVADYIDGFKKSQVEAFEEFISNENDNLLANDELEKEIELENKIQFGCEVIAYSM